ncbi:hypothetical protein SEVIR_9G578050v4 [Setaria viridis]
MLVTLQILIFYAVATVSTTQIAPSMHNEPISTVKLLLTADNNNFFPREGPSPLHCVVP